MDRWDMSHRSIDTESARESEPRGEATPAEPAPPAPGLQTPAISDKADSEIGEIAEAAGVSVITASSSLGGPHPTPGPGAEPNTPD
eukprot:scaffold25395_cov73-Isochrysis_galbana.AAC.1